MIRKFDLELFDTTEADVEAVCDAFFPMPTEDSKGVRVLVRNVETKVGKSVRKSCSV